MNYIPRIAFRLLLLSAVSLPGLLLSDPAPQALTEEQKAALYEKVFGKKKKKAKKTIVPLIIDKEDKGSISVVIDPVTKVVTMEAAPLLTALKKLIIVKSYTDIQSLVSSKGTLTSSEVSPLGVIPSFNHQELLLEIYLDGPIRKVRNLSMQPASEPNVYDAITYPYTSSGYVNFYFSQKWQHNKAKIWTNSTRSPLQITALPSFQYNKWVFQGEVNFQEKAAQNWSRGPLYATYDFPEPMLRLNIGDINYSTLAFQSFIPLGGIGISKDFSLQPYLVTTPISQQEFYLKEPSSIEVWSNGRFLQQFSLPPGPYNLYNLPLAQGYNDVTLKIITDSGREEELNLNLMQDIRLLKQGMHKYTYNVGLSSKRKGVKWHYDQNLPTISLFHQYGATAALTLGGFFQGNKERSVGGFDTNFSLPMGLFSLRSALSYSKLPSGGRTRGHAANFAYLFQNTDVRSNPLAISFSAGVDYQSPTFALPSTLSFSTFPTAIAFSTRYSQKITKNWTGIYSYTYSSLRNTSVHPYSSNLTLRWHPGNRLDFSIDFRTRKTQEGLLDRGIIAQVSMNLPGDWGRVTYSRETDADRNALAWNYSNSNLSTSITGTNQRSSNNLGGTMTYRDDRFRALASHAINSTNYLNSYTASSHISLATAFVFAKGRYGFSDPIQESYALFIPDKTTREKSLDVISTRSFRQSFKGLLGVPVLHNLTAYQYHPITLEVPNIPLGQRIEQTTYTLFPSYQSGTVIPVTIASSVAIKGRLIDSYDQPIKLIRGIVFRLEEGKKKRLPVQFFTNKRGKFFLAGVKPGSYVLKLISPNFEEVHFNVPEDKKGIYSIGTLKVTMAFR